MPSDSSIKKNGLATTKGGLLTVTEKDLEVTAILTTAATGGAIMKATGAAEMMAADKTHTEDE
jgi:hypothetical protein